MRTPLQQRDNLPAGNQIKNDFQVQQLDTLSMMDQLAQELGEMMLLNAIEQVKSCLLGGNVHSSYS